MNYTVYIIDLALAFVLLWVAFILHISDNGGKHIAGADLDEHVAAVRTGAEPVADGQGDVDGVAGSDAVPPAVDGDHAAAAFGGRPDLHNGNRMLTNVRDANTLHGNCDSNSLVEPSLRREDADAGLCPSGASAVAAEHADEVRKRNDDAHGGND